MQSHGGPQTTEGANAQVKRPCVAESRSLPGRPNGHIPPPGNLPALPRLPDDEDLREINIIMQRRRWLKPGTELWHEAARKHSANSGKAMIRTIQEWGLAPTPSTTTTSQGVQEAHRAALDRVMAPLTHSLVYNSVGLNPIRRQQSAGGAMVRSVERQTAPDAKLYPHEELLSRDGVERVTELYLVGRLNWSIKTYRDLLHNVTALADLDTGARFFREQCFALNATRKNIFNLQSSASASRGEFWLRFFHGGLSSMVGLKTRLMSPSSHALMRTFNNNAFIDADGYQSPVSSRVVTQAKVNQSEILQLLQPQNGPALYRMVTESPVNYMMSHGFKFDPGSSDEVTLTIDTFYDGIRHDVPCTMSIIVSATRRLRPTDSTEAAANALLDVSSKLERYVQLTKI